MVRSGSAILIVLVLFGPLQTAGAEEPARPADRETAGESPAAVDRILAAIEVVLAHHVDPPARQQMVLDVVRALEQYADKPDLTVKTRQALARRVSGLSTPAELRELLAQKWAQVLARSTLAAADLETRVLEHLCQTLGPAQVTTAKEYAVQEQFAANQYVGIGIALASKDDGPYMARLFPDGPADRAGAREGDLIATVDGVPTAGKPLGEVVDLLRGPEGAQVRLTLVRPHGEQERKVTITRGVVPMQTVEYARLEEEGQATLGHVRLSAIDASGPHELRRIQQALEPDVLGIILDLRGVGGGNPHFGVLLANTLLDGGTIGGVQSRQGLREFKASRNCVFRSLPLAVLVDERTSGAAEWVAAALQDNGRAEVVGRFSRGSGYVMEGVPVPNTDYVLVLRTGVLVRKNGQPLTRDAAPAIDLAQVAMRKLAARRVRPDVNAQELATPYGSDRSADPALDRAARKLRSQIQLDQSAPPDGDQ